MHENIISIFLTAEAELIGCWDVECLKLNMVVLWKLAVCYYPVISTVIGCIVFIVQIMDLNSFLYFKNGLKLFRWRVISCMNFVPVRVDSVQLGLPPGHPRMREQLHQSPLETSTFTGGHGND